MENQQNLPLLLNSLYCEEKEDQWWEMVDDESLNNVIIESKQAPLLFEQDLSWGDDELNTLLSKEEENELFNVLENNHSLVEARHEAIEWILKVVEYYSFSGLTGVLAVNYLDRFLFSYQSSHDSHETKPWMTQLVAVASLSLAAKVEETQVPLLLDLQVEESKYVFEAKTIQRMEILVLTTLQWKMNPVTPLAFIDYITRRLGLNNHFSWKFIARCESLLLAIISDCRFMCYLPSEMATATMLHVFNNIEQRTFMDFQDKLLSIFGINKEKMEECCRLIHEMGSRIDYYSVKKRKYVGGLMVPGSPKGVMEVSFSRSSSSSSDSIFNESWSVAAATASVSSSPEPLSKKTRST